ncbi:MAG: MBL fold metallo-hydrolase [Gammaproteobacteria bacterium]|nr:MBL fold metallo-hydrolase [Gammaproteobacteria bacterium]
MRFSSIGSGSRGNGTLVVRHNTALLIDCGFSVKQALPRLARLKQDPESITAIVVTHEHGDHINGVAVMARRYQIPVWASHGTAMQFVAGELPALNIFSSHERFEIGDLEISPFPVPHDAREPSQFVFSDGAHSLGLLTDVGSTTPHIENSLSGCDALLLESNYDVDMLAQSEYPASLKARISGPRGHLSNQQTAALLRQLDCSRLQHFAAAHLSEQNNSPEIVRETLAAALDCGAEWIGIADQENGLAWRQLG